MDKSPRDLVIIGGGAGGLVVASVASQLGLKVTLIEKNDRLGGDCLHAGCVPSKTLIRTAEVASLMRRSAAFGLPAVDLDVDFAKVSARIREVVDHIQRHDDPDRFRGYGCEVLFGEARFRDAHSVEVAGDRISGRRFVIATGSRPRVPPIPGLDRVSCLTNENIFQLPVLPDRLLVVGAGPVGIEMAQAFNRLGSRVTVVEQDREILPRLDLEAAASVRAVLSEEGVGFRLASSVMSVEPDGEGGVAWLEGGSSIPFDRILIAVGRAPNLESLDLEAAGVRYGPRGLETDRRLRTSQRHIFAVGDVAGPYPLTHMAEYQAGVVISNVVFRLPKKVRYQVVPQVVYSAPELAQVGATEQELRDAGRTFKVLRFEFADNDRALAEGETAGFAKLLVHRRRLLGATVVGHHGGELIHELALAMEAGVPISKIAATVHAYPTLSQIHRRAVNSGYSQALFSPFTRKLVGWLNRWLP